jgi:hypothetical protein
MRGPRPGETARVGLGRRTPAVSSLASPPRQCASRPPWFEAASPGPPPCHPDRLAAHPSSSRRAVVPSPVSREGQDGAVGTPARGPDNAFNVRELRGVWQPATRGWRGARRLTGGAHSSAFFELKITLDENSSK